MNKDLLAIARSALTLQAAMTTSSSSHHPEAGTPARAGARTPGGADEPPWHPGSGEGTVFDWHRRRHRSLRLPIYLLVSVSLLSIFFYLFQITYPTPERTLPRGQEITLLTPTDPAARGILRRIGDLTVASALPLAPTQDAVDWGEIAPRLEPSFASHEFHPLDLPEVGDQTGLPELLPAGSLRPPAADLPELPPPLQPDGRVLPDWRPVAAGGLADWTVVEAPPLSPEVRGTADPLPIEFTAAADAYGRIRFLMPLGQDDRRLHEQIWRHASQIRLAPPAGEGGATAAAGLESPLIWGILRWLPEAP